MFEKRERKRKREERKLVIGCNGRVYVVYYLCV